MFTRRRLVGTFSLLGTAGLAGCLTTVTTVSEERNTDDRDTDDGGTDDRGTHVDGTDDAGTADPLPDGGNPTDDGDDNTRPRGTGGPGVGLAGLDPQLPLPIRVDVAVTRESATDEHPPGLRVTVTDTSEERIGLGEGRAVVFAYRHSTDASLLLLPAEYDAPAEAGCWRLTDGIAVTQEYRTLDLGPGESVEQDLSLYAAHDDVDACLPVGQYRFESGYTVFETPDRPSEGEQSTWGFSVLLE